MLCPTPRHRAKHVCPPSNPLRRKRCFVLGFTLFDHPLAAHWANRLLNRHRANLKTPVYGFYVAAKRVRAVVGGSSLAVRQFATMLTNQLHELVAPGTGPAPLLWPVFIRPATSYEAAMHLLEEHLKEMRCQRKLQLKHPDHNNDASSHWMPANRPRAPARAAVFRQSLHVLDPPGPGDKCH